MINQDNDEGTASQTFDDYTETRLPAGYFLFFPALREKRRHHPDDSELRIMIAAGPSRTGRAVSGRLIGSVLHVDLDDDLFLRLSGELAERDLKQQPIAFEWDLDAEGNLLELYLDGRAIGGGGSSGLKSDFSELVPGASQPERGAKRRS